MYPGPIDCTIINRILTVNINLRRKRYLSEENTNIKYQTLASVYLSYYYRILKN